MTEWVNSNHQAFSIIATAVSGLLVAIFTGAVWWLQRQSYAYANFANVKIAASRATMDVQTKKVVIELLLINSSQSPAIIKNWNLIIRKNNNQEDASKSPTIKSITLKAPGNVQGEAWALQREKPLALAVEHTISNSQIGKGAMVFAEITYMGGKKEEIIVKHDFEIV